MEKLPSQIHKKRRISDQSYAEKVGAENRLPLIWVDWFNNRRLLEPIGHIPPAEAEANYYAALKENTIAAQPQPNCLRGYRNGSLGRITKRLGTALRNAVLKLLQLI